MKINKPVVSKLFAILFAASFFTGLTCCKQEQIETSTSNTIEIKLQTGNTENLISTPQKWHVTNKRILVLFGYDFNTPEIKETIIEMLGDNYGLDQDGGLIYPLVYPDDFKRGTRSYISELTSYLQSDDKEFAGVILLGAPENTHAALARNQDKWNQEVPYAVIALFPQDDVLGIESTCDIVLDKGLSAEITDDEVEGELIAEAPEIIKQAVDYLIDTETSFTRDSSLQRHLKNILKDFKFHHHTDPETGLQSINHFILN
ncbi:hypothetical protein [Treponema sp. Marseille-Q3903]|uniref:hypothetical protein n=1 Tax=Treponema sp. Marseille-Q3903 TaxID=2766703 RepID=UPI001651BA8A|nr:hypothetical protein [Treponema sp. Marseille-Q3903]MBC6714412.1 hypothetical protein [Treponema sp. Marseille-Q3903]